MTVPADPATSGLAKVVVTTNWSAGAGLTTTGTGGGDVRVVPDALLVAVSEIDPLVSATRSLNVALPLAALTVGVPPRVPTEPLARAAVTCPVNDVSRLL